MKSIIEEYLDYHNMFTKKYGDSKTLVMMQVGSFYEAYSTNTLGPNLQDISNLINIICTRKNKAEKDISIKNPFMLGFPIVAHSKFFKILVDNGYTIVVVDQTSPPPNPKREIVSVLSPGTYIENIYTPESNFTACVYFEETPYNHGLITCAGMSAIDLSSGKCYTHETISKNEDDKLALDETIRFLNGINPKEVVVVNTSSTKLSKDFVINYMELDKRTFHYKDQIDKKYTKLSFQNEMLKNIYPKEKSMISPIEYLDLDKTIYALISLITLLDFIVDHNNKLLIDINKPEQYLNNTHLVLGNNAIYQLNITNDSHKDSRAKFKSLLDVVNLATTSMGKRYVRDRVLSPLINGEKLTKIYDNAELLLCESKWKEVEKFLSYIQDIERLKRRIGLQLIHPYEMNDIIKSCENLLELNKFLCNDPKLKKLRLDSTAKGSLKRFVANCNKNFNLELLKIFPLDDIKESFFNKGIFAEIDTLQDSVFMGQTFIQNMRDKLSQYIQDDKPPKKKPKFEYKKVEKKVPKEKININRNDKDGYYLSLTPVRAKLLRHKLNNTTIVIEGNKIDTSKLQFEELKNNVKIKFPFLKEKSDEIHTSKDELCDLVKEKYLEFVANLYQEYSCMFTQICNFVSEIDYYKAIAKTASIYNYKRPKIIDGNVSSVSCKNLRHPIVERIIDYEYKPHSLELGKDLKGMLIYGVNSSGKSVLMKAVGLGVIMAQSGFFVPASDFTYTPYHSIYARITGNDNLFKGLSSFVVEMVELNSIQKRADRNALIIGDEVCRGTEHISGNALVAATILKLSKSESSFIFATHLHEIMDLEDIQKLSNVRAYHLSVEHDSKTDSLIFDRRLKEGRGDKLYGITIAKCIITDKDFIATAQNIKNKLLETPDSIIPDKRSRYNKGVYVYQCQLCGLEDKKDRSQLDTHHINFQKDCKDGFAVKKDHIKKNAKHNLIVLCKRCHQNLHNDKIKIEGYVMTTKGVVATVDQ